MRATDADGRSSYFTGSVNTFELDLSVTFSSVRIIHDGDWFWRGAGDLYFDFAVNRLWKPEWSSPHLSRSDGEYYYPNRTQNFGRYTDVALDLAVHAMETDEPWLDFEPLPVFVGGSEAPTTPGRGSGDNYQWARAATRIFLSSSFDHVQDATETVTFDSPSDDGLMFRVEATLNFNYHL